MNFSKLLCSLLPIIFVMVFYFKANKNAKLARFWGNQKWTDVDLLYVLTIYFVLYLLLFVLSENDVLPIEYLFVYGNLLTIIVIGIVSFSLVHKKTKRIFSPVGFSSNNMISRIIIGFSCFILLSLIVVLSAYVTDNQKIFLERADVFNQIKLHKWPIVHSSIYVLGLTIISPFIEEYIFRGMFYGVYLKKLGKIGSTLFTSATWASLHIQPDVFLELFLVGILLCFLYSKTKSIIPPLILHSMFNSSNFIIYLAYR